jgi:TolB-like protein
LPAMQFAFGEYELDLDKSELRASGMLTPVEPQVFALLRLLIENRDRLVGKAEIVDRIWGGRIVSDDAITSRIKSARHAIGDSGEAQALIRTIPRLGFRFVGEVTAQPRPRAGAESGANDAPGPRLLDAARPSIAVLPFSLVGIAGPYAPVADALPHDLIVELSRLRWLFVIARGSSFQFQGGLASMEAVRDALKVRYCLTGVVEIVPKRIDVTVELSDTQDGGVVWSERYQGEVSAVHEIRRDIVTAVVNALELQIPLNEARLALKSPENLDAWSAYHLGLHQMYRFNRDGSRRAAAHFEAAVAKEPGFARAYAGLSFAHFEGAFLNFADDPQEAASLARRFAELGLEHDPLDPFCNLVMGRAHWLTGDLESGLPWLVRAIDLNPNYAQGRYSRAWTETLLGQSLEARALVDSAIELSPLDPLHYAMLGVRAFACLQLGEPDKAAFWAERAARSPGAHALIELIAAAAHGVNGDMERAVGWSRSAQSRQPGLSEAAFFKAFPFRNDTARTEISRTLKRLGL